MKEIYAGQLVYASNGEEDELLGLLREDHHARILAEDLDHDVARHGRFLTIRYFVSETRRTPSQLVDDWTGVILGKADCAYGMAYSEYTGYLWTDEKLTVGGHDVLKELRSHIGKFLYMEIEFHKQPMKEAR